jgi:dihydrofolate reductase
MRELISDLFISLDGFAAGENTPGYFGMLGPELEAWVRENINEPQEMVMGRRTYDMLAQFANTPNGTDESARRMDELRKIVLSHTLRDPLPWTPARVIGGDLAEVVGELKREDGPVLRTIGSISLVRDLVAAGLLDRLRLVVFPIVLGGDGREPAFADHRGGRWSSSTATCSMGASSAWSTGRQSPGTKPLPDAWPAISPRSRRR